MNDNTVFLIYLLMVKQLVAGSGSLPGFDLLHCHKVVERIFLQFEKTDGAVCVGCFVLNFSDSLKIWVVRLSMLKP